jgi:hypothetical protein
LDLLKVKLTELLAAVEQDDYACVHQLQRDPVSSYTSEEEIVDWIYQ